MFPWSFTIELICLIFALIFLANKQAVTYWHFFIYYLLFIVLLEGLGWTLWFVFKIKNHWLYNIELPITFFFLWWFLKIESEKNLATKLLYTTGAIIFSVIYLYDTIRNSFFEYNQLSATTRAVLFLLASVMFYYLLIKGNDYVKISTYAPFWLITGIFMFYFISTATTIFFKQLSDIYLFNNIPLHHFVYTFLNLLLYGCWIYAFKCRKYHQNI